MKITVCWIICYYLLFSFDYHFFVLVQYITLHKISKSHLFSWYGYFVKRHSFHIVLGESRKLYLSTKFPNQEIRWNFGILRSTNFSNSWIWNLRSKLNSLQYQSGLFFEQQFQDLLTNLSYWFMVYLKFSVIEI